MEQAKLIPRAEPQSYEHAEEIYLLTEAIENELRLLRCSDGICLLSFAECASEAIVAAILARRLNLYHRVRIEAVKLPLAG